MSATMHPLWELLRSSVQADAVRAGISLGLFDCIQSEGSPEAMAEKLKVSASRLQPLLDLLTEMQLLSVAGNNTYGLSETARQYLCSHSPYYCGDAWLYRLQSLRNTGSAIEALLQGKSDFVPATAWERAARKQLAQEQRAISARAALSVVRELPEYVTANDLLDLGGGPGFISSAFAEDRKDLEVTLFDLPGAADVARQNLAIRQLSDRIRVEEGHFPDQVPSSRFDLLWCSSVLHFVPDLQSALSAIAQCLRPGGVLVSAHSVRDTGTAHSTEVLAYYLPLLLRDLLVVDSATMMRTLESAGLHIREYTWRRDFPVAPLQIVIAEKPA